MAKKDENGGAVRFLYGTVPGRMALKLLAGRGISKAAGRFLDSPASKFLIPVFIKNCGIDLSDYQTTGWSCFNDCFTRKLKSPKLRPFSERAEDLCAPCDGLLSVYPIDKGRVLPIKQSLHTISELLGGSPLARRYREGTALVFRLCVDHYHRYAYLDEGTKGSNRFIPGELHTVRPAALQSLPVFTRNCREFTCLETKNFGPVTQVEVGAMLVGKIKNHHGACHFERGEEKGLFLYGGSTVVLLLEKDRAELDPALQKAQTTGEEIPVKMGQVIGRAIH